MKVGIVLSTIRKNRKSADVANFVLDVANGLEKKDVEFELVDLRDYNLPLFDEALPPAAALERESEEAKVWAKKLDELDMFIFVNAEYNRSIPGSFKNALDFVSREFRNKAGAIISYGSTGGNSSVDHLRLVVSRLGLTVVRNQPFFTNSTDFDKSNNLLEKSKERTYKSIETMIKTTIEMSRQLSK
ncbi:MAG: NAD(P)H-dependent oxidoreductase [Erysipelothrix sp.]|nr:NAD(P)H-dependent oxidoreductase [Erysipelothrix sp.]